MERLVLLLFDGLRVTAQEPHEGLVRFRESIIGTSPSPGSPSLQESLHYAMSWKLNASSDDGREMRVCLTVLPVLWSLA